MLLDATRFKTCSKCRCTKPATPEFFNRDRRREDGLHMYCKTCNRVASKRWRKENPDASRRWLEANWEQKRGYFKRWYEENREKQREYLRRWYEENREERLVKGKHWRAKNPEKMRALKNRWRAENPERAATHYRNRRARQRAAEGTHTCEDLEAIAEAQDFACAYCGIPLVGGECEQVHVDHKIPLSRGGSNWPENLALSCAFCNLSKHAMTAEEFMEGRGPSAEPLRKV